MKRIEILWHSTISLLITLGKVFLSTGTETVLILQKTYIYSAKLLTKEIPACPVPCPTSETHYLNCNKRLNVLKNNLRLKNY